MRRSKAAVAAAAAGGAAALSATTCHRQACCLTCCVRLPRIAAVQHARRGWAREQGLAAALLGAGATRAAADMASKFFVECGGLHKRVSVSQEAEPWLAREERGTLLAGVN